jgi:predicted RNA-binding protein with PUA-like domain
MKPPKKFWLVKSEPQSYGIDALRRDKKTAWTGVRNFQARNYMRDDMQVGDTILFYHSSCKVPGVYGLAEVASKSYADPTQFDAGGHYYEPRATKEKPVWFLVDVVFVQELKEPVTLSDIRADSRLRSMMILQPGSRLSITPVDETHAEIIMNMSR